MSEDGVENLKPPAGGTGVWRRVHILAAAALGLGAAACASIDPPPAPANVAHAAPVVSAQPAEPGTHAIDAGFRR